MNRLIALVSLTLLAGSASAGSIYRIVLTDDATGDGRSVAATYGGTVEQQIDETTLDVSVPDSRVPLISRDPRVRHFAPAPAAEPRIGTNGWAAGMTYAYDAAGNVTQIGADTFAYDDVDRIVSGTVTGHKRKYEYDAFGNRTKCEDVTSGGDCQAVTIASATNRISLATYDETGNLTQFGAKTYTYDAVGMLKRDTAAPQTREYLYTADDERIAVIAGSTWNWTLRGFDGKVLREMTSTAAANGTHGNWQWVRDYVWRDGLLLSSVQPSGASTLTLHYHLDHLGTPRLVSNTAGTLIGTHDYFAFGTELGGNPSENPASRLKFTGHERDTFGAPSEPLDYMHARYYSAQWGRFLSVDPLRWIDLQNGSREERQQFREFIANPQNFNMYAYVSNNPMNRTDPRGLKGCQAGDKTFSDCTMTIVYDPKTSQGMLTVTGQNKGDKEATVLLTSSVVVGGDGHVTPTGTFTASVWEKDHVSTKYGSAADTPWSKTLLGGNAFGPYQLHIKELDSRGIYIHGTMGPRWSPTTWGNRIFLSPTSHGCVRMCNADIFSLHDMMPNPRGNKIIISNQPEPED
jgi:RHS repeat-associated protein